MNIEPDTGETRSTDLGRIMVGQPVDDEGNHDDNPVCIIVQGALEDGDPSDYVRISMAGGAWIKEHKRIALIHKIDEAIREAQ